MALKSATFLALYSLGGTVRDTSKPRGAPDAFIKLLRNVPDFRFVFRVFRPGILRARDAGHEACQSSGCRPDHHNKNKTEASLPASSPPA